MRERRMAKGRADPTGGGFLRGRTIRPTTAERRQEQARLEEEALGLLPHQRQNEPPRPRDPALDCPQSAYGVHRFAARNSAGLTCCEFCGGTLRAWLEKKRGRA